MQIPQKKIIAVHDLSGIGLASLTAALPIISAMGSAVCPMPTAILSTITGVFTGFTFVDLTDHMQETLEHWKTLDMKFNYIYSGFLGNSKQVDIILDTKKAFDDCSLIVDPVFADEGKLYPTMDMSMVANMRKLIAKADIITPNVTEAMFLLGEDELPENREVVKNWLVRLCAKGCKKAAITSLRDGEDIYVMAYEAETGEFFEIIRHYIPVSLHGTGDVFTSVLVGAIARGDSFYKATETASDFVYKAIEITLAEGADIREGIRIQKLLKEL